MVESGTLRSINTFLIAYAIIFVGSMLVVSLDGFDFTTNFTGVTATINNIGPGLGKVGPMGNFSEYSILSKLAFSFNMLAGRLEIFPMLVLLSPEIWASPFKARRRKKRLKSN